MVLYFPLRQTIHQQPEDPTISAADIITEGALDLTDLPHEVIDLSHSNPVDLSGGHPHLVPAMNDQLRSLPWEPEPGFSFTELLNDDGVLFEAGLDLRLPEIL